jgi:hypothetical protein
LLILQIYLYPYERSEDHQYTTSDDCDSAGDIPAEDAVIHFCSAGICDVHYPVASATDEVVT